MKVFSFTVSLSHDKDLAEEITQNTFFKVFMTDKNHRGESSEFTWLCAIAKNMYIEHMRKEQRICNKSVENASSGDIESTLISKETSFQIHQLLHEMEEPYKEVFTLRVFGELSFQKIGFLFSKTENWARVTYYRARIKLQERMEKQ